MYKNSLPGMVAEQLQESRKDLIPRKRAMPWNGNVLHTKFADLFPLAVALGPANIDDDLDSHLRQFLESFVRRLRPAIERRRDLGKIPHALEQGLPSHGVSLTSMFRARFCGGRC